MNWLALIDATQPKWLRESSVGYVSWYVMRDYMLRGVRLVLSRPLEDQEQGSGI